MALATEPDVSRVLLVGPQDETIDEPWWYFHGAPPRPGDLIEIEREGEGRRARVLACVDSYGLEAGAVIMATPLA